MASYFLTETLAKEAVALALPAIKKLMATRTGGRNGLHIVILDPTITPAGGGSFAEAILYEHQIGDPEGWKHDYVAIARSKAEQAWRDGRPNLWTHLFAPALIVEGDARYWSSFVYNGLVVACSGIQPWFDFLVGGWVALACQQLAQDEKQVHDEATGGGFYR